MHCNICLTSEHDYADCPNRQTRQREEPCYDEGWHEASWNKTPAPVLIANEAERKNKILEEQDQLAMKRHNRPFYQLGGTQQKAIRTEVEAKYPEPTEVKARQEAQERTKSIERLEAQAQFLLKKAWHQCTDHEQEEVRRSIDRCDRAREEMDMD